MELLEKGLEYENVYYSDLYVGYLLDKNSLINHLQSEHIKKNDLLIWDYWFSPSEGNVSLDSLRNDSRLKKVFEVEKDDESPFYIKEKIGDKVVERGLRVRQ